MMEAVDFLHFKPFPRILTIRKVSDFTISNYFQQLHYGNVIQTLLSFFLIIYRISNVRRVETTFKNLLESF